MEALIIFTLVCLAYSFYSDREKTWLGVKNGLKMFFNILQVLTVTVILIAILLYFLPNEIIVKYLGKESGFYGAFFAALIGSVALIPGFIAYPLAGIMVKSGVSYSVVAIFMTTLMMVGILSLPLEAKYFGLKIAIIRNVLFFVAAIIIGLIVGLLM